MNYIKRWLLKNYVWLILFLAVTFLIYLMRDIYKNQIIAIDKCAYEFIVNNMRQDWLTPIMIFTTNLSGAVALIAITLITIIMTKNKKVGLAVIFNLIGIVLLNLILKNILQRPRPYGYHLIEESGYSFPSGHSMVSMAFYGLLIYISYIKIKNVKLRNFICVFLAILILLIGFSRIYLGVHYASDVIAGFIISLIYLILLIKTVSKLTVKEKRRIKKTKKILNSFKYAFSGIRLAFKTERNMKIYLAITILVIMMGIILKISAMDWILCVFAIGLVVSSELINTSIEVLTDVVMPEKNYRAKIVKDVAAGAVLVSSISAGIIGLIIFIPKIFG